MEKTYSVQTANNMFNNDEFNGTYQECLDYVHDLDAYNNTLSMDCRIVSVEIDETGLVWEALGEITEE